jgi:RNAse (barnase) inhibitor barstar
MNESNRAIEIDLRTITSNADLHERLAEALRFPAYYGRNWDAFRDLINADAYLGVPLSLIGWDTLQQRLPRDAALHRRCLDDLRAQFPADTCDVIYD